MILLAAGMFFGQLIAWFKAPPVAVDVYKPTFTGTGRRSKPERHTVALRVEESRTRRGIDQSLPGAFGRSPPGSALLPQDGRSSNQFGRGPALLSNPR